MNKFFNKISLDLNLSFGGISRISEYNFDKVELNVLRVARLLFQSNEYPNAQAWKSADISHILSFAKLDVLY